MQAISHSPSGNQSMHKESHCDSNGYEPWYCNTACPLCASSQRSFSVQGVPVWGNANEFHKLMSAQTHGRGLEACAVECCLSQQPQPDQVNTQNPFTAWLFFHQPPHPLEAVVFCPCPWSGGNSEWGGTTTSSKHRRRKPPSCLIDFVFSG